MPLVRTCKKMPLKVSDGIGSWIKDFKKSDAPQFKGKSEKERRDQAIAAYLSAKRGGKKLGEAWQTISKTPDGNYKIQRDSETGARRKVPAQVRTEETPTGKQVKQAIGIARDKRYAKGNMTGAVKAMDKINPKLSGHPKVKGELQKQNEDAFTKKAVDSGKVKTGPSKARMAAMKKQDDNRPTLRKKTNEQLGVKHVFRYVTTSGQGTYHHDSSDKADAKKAIEKSTGARVLGINHIGTGIPSRRENRQANEEFVFKVDVEGLPSMFMKGNSPGEVKTHLRKLVKQPSMVKSVERQTKHDVKKARRKQAVVGEGMNRRDRLRAKLAAVGKDMEKTNKELKKTVGIEDKPKPYKGKYITKEEMSHSQDWGKPGSTKRAKEVTPGEKNEKLTFAKVRKGLYKTAKAMGDVQAVRKKKVGKRIKRRILGKLAGKALGALTR